MIFEVLMAVSLKFTISLECDTMQSYRQARHFRGNCCLHLQDRSVSQMICADIGGGGSGPLKTNRGKEDSVKDPYNSQYSTFLCLDFCIVAYFGVCMTYRQVLD